MVDEETKNTLLQELRIGLGQTAQNPASPPAQQSSTPAQDKSK